MSEGSEGDETVGPHWSENGPGSPGRAKVVRMRREVKRRDTVVRIVIDMKRG